jgi:hypothetical protein
MQTQEFDPKKSHGVIYGHDTAIYEQNGNLYDGAGNFAAESEEVPEEKVTIKKKKEPASGLAEFLTGLLSGGPIMQINVKKECEKAGYEWSELLTVSAEMGLKKFKKGALMMWQLPEEESA